MALITGGNLLIAALATIVLMVIVVLIMFVLVFNLDNLLSVSLVNLVAPNAEKAVEEATTENVTEEKTIAEKLNTEEARQLLGFIQYPVVNLEVNEINIFSPQAIDSITPLSEAEIQQRCSQFSLPFNRARCLRAERNCATALKSDEEHWQCMEGYGYYLGKDL